MEPTRNACVPLAAWRCAQGAAIVLDPPRQSADLRRYCERQTKNDPLDSRVLSRLPLHRLTALIQLLELLDPAHLDLLGGNLNTKTALACWNATPTPQVRRAPADRWSGSSALPATVTTKTPT